VRLIAAASALRESIGSVIDPADRLEYQSRLNTLRAKVGKGPFEVAWDAGRALPLEQAVAYALES
jgi:hypothetical protein